MTREESLPKDEALAEIMAEIRKLPAVRVVIGGDDIVAPAVSRVDVLQLILRYGFN